MTDLLRGEELGEGWQDAPAYGLPDVIERLDDLFPGGWPVAVKRYIKRGAQVHVHLRVVGADLGSTEYCAFFEPSRQGRGDRGDVDTKLVESDQAGRENVLGQIQRPVFVPAVQFVEVGERFFVGVAPSRVKGIAIRSIERLQLLKDCLRSWRDAPNLLGGSRDLEGTLGEDRELGFGGPGIASDTDQLPHEVVKGGAHVVDAVTDDRADVGRVGTITLRPEDVLAGLGIVFAGDVVGFRVDDLLQGALDGIEVGIRPRELRLDPVEVSDHA